MKFNRNVKIFFIFIASLLLIAAVMVSVLLCRLPEVGRRYIEKVENSLTVSSKRFSLTYSSLDRKFLTNICIHDLSILMDDEEVVCAPEIRVSAGLMDFVRMALGKDTRNVELFIEEPVISINQNLLDYFSKSKPSEGGSSSKIFKLPGSDYINNLKTNIINSLKDKFLDRNFSVNISKSRFEIELEDFRLNASETSVGFKFSAESGLTDFSGNTDSVEILIPSQNIVLNLGVVKGSLIENGVVSVNADSIDCRNVFIADTAVSYIDFRNFPVVNGSFNVNEFSGSFNDFSGDFSGISFKVSLSVDQPDKVDFTLVSQNADVGYKGNSGTFNDIEVDLGLNGASKDIEVGIGKGEITSNYGDFDLESIHSSYNDEGLSIKVGNIKNNYLVGDTQLSFETNDFKLLKGSFKLDTRISADISYNLDSGDASVDAFVKDLNIADYGFVYRKKVSILDNFISQETTLNGNLNAVFNIKTESPVIDVVSDFKITDLKAGTRSVSMEAVIDASMKDNNIDFYNLSYSVLGKTIAYTGSFNLGNYLPIGRFTVLDEESSNYLAYMDFNYTDETKTYSFEGALPYVIDSSITGKVEMSQSGVYNANGILSTKYRDYPVDVLFDRVNDVLTVNGSGLDFKAQMDDKRYVDVSGKADGFIFSVSDVASFGMDFVISGGIDLFNAKWNLAFTDTKLKISDKLSLGFNLEIDQQGFELDEISMKNPDVALSFDGGIRAEGIDFRKFAAGDFSQFGFKANLSIPQTDQVLKFVYTDASYWADVNLRLPVLLKLSLLGSKANGTAHAQIGELAFDFNFDKQGIVFSNAVLGEENTKIDSADFYIDFADRSLNGSFKITNTLKRNTEDIKQGATLEVSAKLDSLRATALSIAGIEAKAVFDINMKDTYLGDFDINDNKFKLTVDMKSAVVEGDFINGSYTFSNKAINLNLDKKLNIGFEMNGSIGKNLDLMLTDLWFDSTILNQFTNTRLLSLENGILTGDILVNGPSGNPELFGMLYSDNIGVKIFFLPDQIISLKGPSICLSGHNITMPYTSCLGYSYSDGRQFDGKINLNAVLDNLGIDSLSAGIIVKDKPIDMWLPLIIQNHDVMMRGDILGDVDLWFREGQLGVSGAIDVSDFYLSFRFPPELDIVKTPFCALDLDMTFGSDVKLHYPDVYDSFLTFTFTEGTEIRLINDPKGRGFAAEGDLKIQTGRIFYINNELLVTDGKVHLSKDVITGQTDFSFDATAKLREYDSTGQPVDIFFVFQNSTFNNLAPKIQSSTGLSENEILRVLGQQIVGSEERNSSFTALAQLAASATTAIQSLGIRGQKQYSIASSIKDSLKLDVFSLRSQIFQNIIIDSLPVSNDSAKSLLSRYLDGTSLFVGKYIGQNMFIRGTAMLNSVNKSAINNKVGHFIAEDLNLDFELSFDWDIPFGTFSMFTQPQELSVFSFADNFGISLNNHFKF